MYNEMYRPGSWHHLLDSSRELGLELALSGQIFHTSVKTEPPRDIESMYPFPREESPLEILLLFLFYFIIILCFFFPER